MEKVRPTQKEIFKDTPIEATEKLLKEVKGYKIIELGNYPLNDIDYSRARRFLILGETGCGKSTLINAFANFFNDVAIDDKYRYKVVIESTEKKSTQSQTEFIKEYHFKSVKDDIPFILIDTPGFADTSGVNTDKGNLKKLFDYLKNACATLDAICFVMKASTNRLTATQKYIAFNVLQAFGKDVEKNVFYFYTFADHTLPIAHKMVQETNLPVSSYFKFNNSALYPEEDNEYDIENDNILRNYWEMFRTSINKFLKLVYKSQPITLIQTGRVIELREMLEILMEKLLKDIQMDLNSLTNLKIIQEKIKEESSKIDNNQPIKVKTKKLIYVEKQVQHHTTYCLTCKTTCHVVCQIEKDENKNVCLAMDKSTGYCKVCPNKCIWSVHKNTKFIVEEKYEEVEEIINAGKDLKTGISKSKAMLDNFKKDFEKLRNDLMMHVVQAKLCLEELQKIALRPTSGKFDEYIEQLIITEETKKNPGYEQRIEELKDLQKQTEILEELKEKNQNEFLTQNFNTTKETLENLEKDLQEKIDQIGNDPNYA